MAAANMVMRHSSDAADLKKARLSNPRSRKGSLETHPARQLPRPLSLAWAKRKNFRVQGVPGSLALAPQISGPKLCAPVARLAAGLVAKAFARGYATATDAERDAVKIPEACPYAAACLMGATT